MSPGGAIRKMLAAPQLFVDYYGSTGSLSERYCGVPDARTVFARDGVEVPIFGAKRLKGGRLGDGVLVCISLRQLLRAAYTSQKFYSHKHPYHESFRTVVKRARVSKRGRSRPEESAPLPFLRPQAELQSSAHTIFVFCVHDGWRRPRLRFPSSARIIFI